MQYFHFIFSFFSYNVSETKPERLTKITVWHLYLEDEDYDVCGSYRRLHRPVLKWDMAPTLLSTGIGLKVSTCDKRFHIGLIFFLYDTCADMADN